MEQYLEIYAIVCGLLWVAILVARIRVANRLSKEFGIPLRHILTLGFNKNLISADNPRRESADKAFQAIQRVTFRIWVVVLVTGFIGAIVVGWMTH